MDSVWQYIGQQLGNEKGFSYLEIVVCCMIILLSVSVVMPKITLTDELRLQYEAINIINHLRVVQQKDAILSLDVLPNKNDVGTYGMRISQKENSYSIVRTMKNGEKVIDTCTVPNDIQMKSNKQIYFFSRNWATPGSITLIKNNHIRKIVIDGPGRIRMIRDKDA